MSDRFGDVIHRMAGEAAAALGVEVVECRLHRQGPRLHVRIDIDRAGVDGVGIEDCKALSRRVENEREEGGTISGSFTLEVSSPGIDRPIQSEDDVRRNTGRRVLVKTRADDGTESALYGTLVSGDASRLILDDGDGSQVEVPRKQIVVVHQDVSF